MNVCTIDILLTQIFYKGYSDRNIINYRSTISLQSLIKIIFDNKVLHDIFLIHYLLIIWDRVRISMVIVLLSDILLRQVRYLWDTILLDFHEKKYFLNNNSHENLFWKKKISKFEYAIWLSICPCVYAGMCACVYLLNHVHVSHHVWNMRPSGTSACIPVYVRLIPRLKHENGFNKMHCYLFILIFDHTQLWWCILSFFQK